MYCELVANDPSYYVVSQNTVIRQAIGVWKGLKPVEIVRLAKNDNHLDDLKEYREELCNLIEGGAFVELSMFRAKGQIMGHFSNEFGVIRITEGPMENSRILFHKEDIYLFRNKLNDRDHLDYTIPVGLNSVYVDARSLMNERSEARDYHEIEYQACAVFVGTWPKMPFPTALPNGKKFHNLPCLCNTSVLCCRLL